MFGLFAPPAVAGSAGENPKQTTEKSFAPIRPRLGFVAPAALFCEEREIVGVASDEAADLLLGKVECGVGGCHWRLCRD